MGKKMLSEKNLRMLAVFATAFTGLLLLLGSLGGIGFSTTLFAGIGLGTVFALLHLYLAYALWKKEV